MASLRACLLAVLLVAGTLFASASPSQASKRFALVIGNSNYENTQVLPNAAGDAEEFAAKLKQLGFEVDLGIDLTRPDFKNLVSDFRAKIKAAAAEDVVFFYGGHGFSLDGFNHLVPVDAGLKDKDLLAYETLTLDEIIESIRVTKKQNTVVFIDACRNNPLPKNLRGEGVGDGLSELKMSLRGTLVSFATEHGQLTGDGLGKDSPYARALLKYIDTPNQSVNDLLVNVRLSVSAETNEKQFPVEQGALFGSVIFNRGGEAVAALEEQPQPEPQAAQPSIQAPAEEPDMIFEQVTPEVPKASSSDVPVTAPPVETPAVEAPSTAEPAPEIMAAPVGNELPSSAPAAAEAAPVVDGEDSLSAGKSIAEEYKPVQPESSFNVAALETGQALEPSSSPPIGQLPSESASRTVDPIAEQGETSAEPGAAGEELPSAGATSVIEGVEVLPDEQPAGNGGMKSEAPAASADGGAEQQAEPVTQTAASNTEEMVVALNTPPEDDVAKVAILKGIQEELRRVGCFEGSADGKWGRKSENALGDYFKQKGKSDAGLEPNDLVLGELKGDASGEVCVASIDPGVNEPTPKAEPRKTQQKKPEQKKPERKKPERKKPEQKKPEQKKPAAKPKSAAPAKKKPVLIIGM